MLFQYWELLVDWMINKDWIHELALLVSTVGLNEATIKKYIQDQEKHDIALDKLSVKEYENPFRDGR